MQKGNDKKTEEEDEKEKNQKQFERMTETPVSKLILMLGIPTIISMLITNIYNMADTYFVSRIGTSASGAIGIVFSLMAIIQAFGFMFGHGAGSHVSRSLGEGNPEAASEYASVSFFCSIGAGLVIELLGYLFLTPFMRLLGSTETILPYAKEYAVWILFSSPFLAVSCVLNNLLRYEGLSFYAMIGLTAGGVINMAGDPLLMFGLNLGVTGAGMSTAFSQVISFFILLIMYHKKARCKISFGRMRKNSSKVVSIARVGFPSMARQGLNSISTMLLNNQAAVYGDAAVAAMSIVNRVAFFIFAVGLGLGQGFQPVSAFNYGAKKYSRLKKGFWFTFLLSEVLMLVFAVIGFAFSREIIMLFRNDPDVISIGAFALHCACIACLFQPFCISCNMMFQSIGKSGRATFLSMLRSGLYFVPLILLLPHLIGLTGIQISQMVSDILAFFTAIPILIMYFRILPADGEKQV